ncbi:MAG: DUF418 domain-containing protein [Pseudomonadota bacterium]
MAEPAARRPGDRAAGARLVRLDIVRGAAVFGILLVNVWAFAWGLTALRYGTLAPDAPWAERAVIFLVAGLAEFKSYPVFAFLFGAGFALHTRALRRTLRSWPAALALYRRRLLLLLGIGVAHGMLIWSGDVLSFYAFGGLLLLPLARARLRHVMQIGYVIGAFFLLTMLVMSLTVLGARGSAEITDAILAYQNLRAIYTSGGPGAIALERMQDFAYSHMSGLVYFLPHTLLLFIFGILAARLGWLSRPERYRRQWRRVALWGFGLGLPLNLLWGWVALRDALDPYQRQWNVMLWQEVLYLAGPCLAAAYIASLMLAGPRWVGPLGRWLAPVGRMALSNYLMQSVVGVLVLQGVGLGWGANISGTGLMAFCGALIVLQIGCSRWWLVRFGQGPVEAWWRRRSLGR